MYKWIKDEHLLLITRPIKITGFAPEGNTHISFFALEHTSKYKIRSLEQPTF